jgi:hypothetical protein
MYMYMYPHADPPTKCPAGKKSRIGIRDHFSIQYPVLKPWILFIFIVIPDFEAKSTLSQRTLR